MKELPLYVYAVVKTANVVISHFFCFFAFVDVVVLLLLMLLFVF